jgi:uncharacterized membrane protein
MNQSRLLTWRVVAMVLLFVVWATAAHLGSAGVGSADFNAAVAVAPLLFAWSLLLWQSNHRWLRWVGLVLAVGLVLGMWSQLRQNIALLYYLQHQGSHLALAALFGRTLTGSGEALITSMDRFIYGDAQSQCKIRYTRQLTLAWTLFFVTNAMVSTALFLWAPATVWSIHANLLTGPLIGLMFLVEHVVRAHVLPPQERPSLADVIRAYRTGVDKRSLKARPPETGA